MLRMHEESCVSIKKLRQIMGPPKVVQGAVDAV
jgi:hypothetical protein